VGVLSFSPYQSDNQNNHPKFQFSEWSKLGLSKKQEKKDSLSTRNGENVIQ
jgi:hypothetical protein